MALAYPEGEVFFNHSSFHQGPEYDAFPGGRFDMENPSVFYGNFLIEYVYNMSFNHGQCAGDNAWNISRTRLMASKVVVGKSSHRYWEYGVLNYGTKAQPSRRLRFALANDPKMLNDSYHEGPAKSIFRYVPMPTKEERWVYIDMNVPIRAIYLPIAQQCNEAYPSLASYLQVNFTQKTNIDIWRGTEFKSHWCNSTYGLRYDDTHTLGLDITLLSSILSLPRQIRKTDVYAAKAITLHYHDEIATRGSMYDSDYTPFVWVRDFADVVSISSGLQLQYKPYEVIKKDPWFLAFFRKIIDFAIGLIPGVGPLLSVAFNVGLQAIFEPEQFVEDFKNILSGNPLDIFLASCEVALELSTMGKKKKPKSAVTGSRSLAIEDSKAVEPAQPIEEVPVSEPKVVDLADLAPDPYFVEAAKYIDTTHPTTKFPGFTWDVEVGGDTAKMLAKLISNPDSV